MDKESILKEVEESTDFKRIKPQRTNHGFKRRKPLTIDRIRFAIKQLEEQGAIVTSTSIGELLGLSRQRVHEALQHSNELYLLPSQTRRNEKERIAIALKDFDTSHLSISEIHELPIDGMKAISPSNLAHLIKKNNIPHSFTKEEKLAEIDTSQYTTEELHKMVGGSYQVLRQFLYKNKIPYKNKKTRQEKGIVESTLQKLNGLDTSKHTIQELFNLAGDGWEQSAFQRLIYQRKIPHWSDSHQNQTRRTDRPKIATALKELNIDSSQYTVRELWELIGEGRSLNHFSSDIYRRKIPYKPYKRTKRGENGNPICQSTGTATLLEKLSEIETPKYSVSRLAAMIGTTYERLFQIVTEHKVPVYKDRRTKEEMAPIWEKLHSIDTTRYTSDELLAFLDHKVGKNVMLKHLAKRGMKYKLLNGDKV